MATVSPVADTQIRPARRTREGYLVVPLQEVKGLKKADDPWAPDKLNDLVGRVGKQSACRSSTATS